MRHARYVCRAVVLGVCTLLFSCAYAEVIRSFDVGIVIDPGDGHLNLNEAIVYDFEGAQRHGIYRDIPLQAANGTALSAQVLAVTDENGNPYTFQTTIENQGLHIRIGDPSMFVSGVKHYVIAYRVANALGQFQDHDELYWNITGNGWKVPIQHAGAVIRVASDTSLPYQHTCYSGVSESAAQDCVHDVSNAGVEIQSTHPLSAGEGLTGVVGFPKGVVSIQIQPQTTHKSITKEDFIGWMIEGGAKFIPFLIVFLSILLRVFSKTLTWGRRFKPKQKIPWRLRGEPIVVSYEPPPGLLPIDVGTLYDRRVDLTDISSVIMSLATRGYIRIKHVVEEIRFWPDREDFEFTKLKSGEDLTHPADRAVFDLLFTGADTNILSRLTTENPIHFHRVLENIKTSVEDKLHAEGYFDENARKRKIIVLAVSVIGFILTVCASELFDYGSFAGFALPFFFGLGLFSFAILRPVFTERGLQTMRTVLGFAQFLKYTEADRLRLINAPRMNVEVFEKFLPYAMVFGVEEEWATVFEKSLSVAPAWYVDTQHHTFTSHSLVHSLGQFDTSINRAFGVTAPRSNKSGFSGGFSGGGGGGGGGGSW